MQRYLVERKFPDGLDLGQGTAAAQLCQGIVERNADDAVTWVQSFVSDDRKTTYCIYDAPDPEAIRKSATRSDLPVDRITPVRVLDPYFHH